MKKTYRIYMVSEDGKETLIDRSSTQELAERKCRKYEREDAYERQIGYHVPKMTYIIK